MHLIWTCGFLHFQHTWYEQIFFSLLKHFTNDWMSPHHIFFLLWNQSNLRRKHVNFESVIVYFLTKVLKLALYIILRNICALMLFIIFAVIQSYRQKNKFLLFSCKIFQQSTETILQKTKWNCTLQMPWDKFSNVCLASPLSKNAEISYFENKNSWSDIQCSIVLCGMTSYFWGILLEISCYVSVHSSEANTSAVVTDQNLW